VRQAAADAREKRAAEVQREFKTSSATLSQQDYRMIGDVVESRAHQSSARNIVCPNILIHLHRDSKHDKFAYSQVYSWFSWFVAVMRSVLAQLEILSLEWKLFESYVSVSCRLTSETQEWQVKSGEV
jgi:hypothetical protein